jgi:UDP-N-acetylglucosamine 2-epimerase (hydrolysing)
MKKKIIFFTASRADYGKLKPIISLFRKNKISLKIIVTGSHLQKEYGYTIKHIIKDFGKKNILSFKNQSFGDPSHIIFEKTVIGLNKIMNKIKSEFFFIHGDRMEILAAASVITFRRIKIIHIEGGEISGSVDEMIRHSVSKLSHIHFVTNNNAKKVLINSGESKKYIFVTGSPDIDYIKKNSRPIIEEVKKRYLINFKSYAISFLHPVTTLSKKTNDNISKIYFKSLNEISNKINIIHFLPNNDDNADLILKNMKKYLKNKDNIKIIPSMRFEHYLTLLEKSEFIIGNSSSAIMEAPYFYVKAINIGNRQDNRYGLNKCLNINFSKTKIIKSVEDVLKNKKNNFKKKIHIFGNGDSSKKILKIFRSKVLHKQKIQKNYKNLLEF